MDGIERRVLWVARGACTRMGGTDRPYLSRLVVGSTSLPSVEATAISSQLLERPPDSLQGSNFGVMA